MVGSAVARYKEVQIQTSSPGELLLALYDGVFRFVAGAKHCLEHGQRARASEQLSRAHAILSELLLALDYAISPELCMQLSQVYDFCLSRITEANVTGRAELLDDVTRVLSPLREAWRIAVPKAAAEAAQVKRGG